MNEPLNPVQIEQNIRQVSNRIAEGVKVCSARYKDFLDADREYDLAFARAYMAHEGPAHEKKYTAEIETIDLRRARDDADGLYRHADRKARSLNEELRAWQSVGASVRMMYATAGVGNGA